MLCCISITTVGCSSLLSCNNESMLLTAHAWLLPKILTALIMLQECLILGHHGHHIAALPIAALPSIQTTGVRIRNAEGRPGCCLEARYFHDLVVVPCVLFRESLWKRFGNATGPEWCGQIADWTWVFESMKLFHKSSSEAAIASDSYLSTR